MSHLIFSNDLDAPLWIYCIEDDGWAFTYYWVNYWGA